MSPKPTEAIKLTHRLVMNFYTAKRLLGALHLAVPQHESVRRCSMSAAFTLVDCGTIIKPTGLTAKPVGFIHTDHWPHSGRPVTPCPFGGS